jgi:hypothetical protein
MRTKRDTPETLLWSASEVYVAHKVEGLAAASANSMMRQRSQNQFSWALTGAGRKWPDKSPNADLRGAGIMPTTLGP